MIEIPKLIKLKDYQVKGNFTIRCHDYEHYIKVLKFFNVSDAKGFVFFRDLNNTKSKTFIPPVGDPPKKLNFILKYESLNELLKLREIFGTRASQFETRLIEKRKYDPFTPDFFDKLSQPIIKIRK